MNAKDRKPVRVLARSGARLAGSAACAALAACASAPPPPSWIDTAGGAPPPIVLRMADEARRNEALPSPGGQFAGHAVAGTMGGVMMALPTLGTSLILVPLGFIEGSKAAGRAGECAERWRAAVGDPPKWLAKALDPVLPLAVVEEETRRLVARPPPLVVFDRTGGTREARAAALDEIGQRFSRTTLLVGDIWIVLEQAERSRCGVKFSGYVHFRVRPVGAASKATPDFIIHASHEEADEQVKAWAGEPELAREAMRVMLRKLAAKVLESYPWR